MKITVTRGVVMSGGVDWERAATTLCVRRIRKSPRGLDPGMKSVLRGLILDTCVCIFLLRALYICLNEFRENMFSEELIRIFFYSSGSLQCLKD